MPKTPPNTTSTSTSTSTEPEPLVRLRAIATKLAAARREIEQRRQEFDGLDGERKRLEKVINPDDTSGLAQFGIISQKREILPRYISGLESDFRELEAEGSNIGREVRLLLAERLRGFREDLRRPIAPLFSELFTDVRRLQEASMAVWMWSDAGIEVEEILRDATDYFAGQQ